MAANPRSKFKSLLGSQLGIAERGNLVVSKANGTFIQLGRPAVDASITVTAEGAVTPDTRGISIQLKDAHGANIDYVEECQIVLYTTAAAVAYVVTGGSTGIVIGANGAIQAIVAKKRFNAITDITGLLTLTWLDTATEACFLGVKLPNGRTVMSSTLTNA